MRTTDYLTDFVVVAAILWLLCGCQVGPYPERDCIQSHEWVEKDGDCSSTPMPVGDSTIFVESCSDAKRTQCDAYGPYYLRWQGKKYWLKEDGK